MLRISTLNGHERLSTQDLLLQIEDAVRQGETDFYISASGQHDIGGPLWNNQGKPLRFTIANPGQRVGSMCLPGTSVIVEGSVPADAGWLNSGGTIVIKGDAGDTAGHCAAGGKIFIGGRAGTRSGSLMKHDPVAEAPELWILNSTGSFSFEFMSGGYAVVCGFESQTLPSVLGERPCVGMVGGVVYFRGPCAELPPDVTLKPLDEADVAWLEKGLPEFLQAISRPKLKRELSLWKHWHKLVPAGQKTAITRREMNAFHAESWPEGGLFGDIRPDDYDVAPLVGIGDSRMNIPEWLKENCTDCGLCIKACPNAAIRRRKESEGVLFNANDKRCTGCGICSAICPSAAWIMRS